MAIEKVIKKGKLSELSSGREELEFWLSKTSAERLAAVEELWRQRHGDEVRLQRVARVVKRAPR